MKILRQTRSTRPRGQQGYILLVLMFVVAMMALLLLADITKFKTQVTRDKEDELIHRGTEYARAIKKFYRKNRRYPAKIEDLENTNNIRYLRRRYKDPMTKGGNWKYLTQADVMQATAGGNTNFMAGGGGANPFAKPEPSPEASPTPSPTPGGGGFGGFGSPGVPMGGGGIWGVASTNTGKSLHEFGKFRNYNKWLFIYDVNQDVQQVGGTPRLLKGPYNPNAFKPTTNQNLNPTGSPTPTPNPGFQ